MTSKKGPGFWAFIILVLILMLIASLILLNHFYPGTFTKLKAFNTINATEKEGNIYINQTVKNEYTTINKTGGTWWKVISIVLFVTVVGLAALLIIKKRTEPMGLKGVEYCTRFALKRCHPNYVPEGKIINHAYKDLGEHSRYAFFIPLLPLYRNEPISNLPDEGIVWVDMSRKDPENDHTGPHEGGFKSWEKWRIETNKRKRGEILSPGQGYRSDLEEFFTDSAKEAAEIETGRMAAQRGASYGQ